MKRLHRFFSVQQLFTNCPKSDFQPCESVYSAWKHYKFDRTFPLCATESLIDTIKFPPTHFLPAAGDYKSLTYIFLAFQTTSNRKASIKRVLTAAQSFDTAEMNLKCELQH